MAEKEDDEEEGEDSKELYCTLRSRAEQEAGHIMQCSRYRMGTGCKEAEEEAGSTAKTGIEEEEVEEVEQVEEVVVEREEKGRRERRGKGGGGGGGGGRRSGRGGGTKRRIRDRAE